MTRPSQSPTIWKLLPSSLESLCLLDSFSAFTNQSKWTKETVFKALVRSISDLPIECPQMRTITIELEGDDDYRGLEAAVRKVGSYKIEHY